MRISCWVFKQIVIIKLFISSITTIFTCFTGNHENLDSCKKLSNINQNDKITHLPKCFFRVEWLLYSKKFYCHFLQIQNEGRRHIWRNFATLAKFLKTLAIFWMGFLGLVKIFNLLWQKIYAIGQNFFVVNGQKLKT